MSRMRTFPELEAYGIVRRYSQHRARHARDSLSLVARSYVYGRACRFLPSLRKGKARWKSAGYLGDWHRGGTYYAAPRNFTVPRNFIPDLRHNKLVGEEILRVYPKGQVPPELLAAIIARKLNPA